RLGAGDRGRAPAHGRRRAVAARPARSPVRLGRGVLPTGLHGADPGHGQRGAAAAGERAPRPVAELDVHPRPGRRRRDRRRLEPRRGVRGRRRDVRRQRRLARAPARGAGGAGRAPELPARARRGLARARVADVVVGAGRLVRHLPVRRRRARAGARPLRGQGVARWSPDVGLRAGRLLRREPRRRGARAPLASGVAMGFFMAVWQTTLQREIPPDRLSRVSSYDWMGSLAFLPAGLALAGPVSDAIGIRTTLFVSAGWVVVSTALVLLVPGVWALRRREDEPAAEPVRAAAESELVVRVTGAGVVHGR